jgi:hypothetical protein
LYVYHAETCDIALGYSQLTTPRCNNLSSNVSVGQGYQIPVKCRPFMQLKNYGEPHDIFCSILLAVLPKTNTKL